MDEKHVMKSLFYLSYKGLNYAEPFSAFSISRNIMDENKAAQFSQRVNGVTLPT